MVHFAREDAPLSVGIVFDMSGSMRDKLAKSREAMDQFLRDANPEDEFFLVEFSNAARLTVPFTTDTGEIRDALASRGGSWPDGPAGCGVPGARFDEGRAQFAAGDPHPLRRRGQ